MDNKELVRKAFNSLFECESISRETILLYFSEDYIQCVDGNTLGVDDFIKHVFKVHEMVTACKITFQTLMAENDLVFSNHIVDAVMSNGEHLQHHVLVEFQMRDGKIIRCDELTRLQKGCASGSNLGSVR